MPTPDRCSPVSGSTATSTSSPNGHSHSGTDGSSAAIQVPASGRSAGAVLQRNTPVNSRPSAPAAGGDPCPVGERGAHRVHGRRRHREHTAPVGIGHADDRIDVAVPARLDPTRGPDHGEPRPLPRPTAQPRREVGRQPVVRGRNSVVRAAGVSAPTAQRETGAAVPRQPHAEHLVQLDVVRRSPAAQPAMYSAHTLGRPSPTSATASSQCSSRLRPHACRVSA